ncbi:MAG TPA: hypothetical protein VJ803_03845 [Gemmatimonadaceae bacterium]|nr:hypothetical protein [Gemmatimonadaceae bacterium]
MPRWYVPLASLTLLLAGLACASVRPPGGQREPAFVISDVRYSVTFDQASAVNRTLHVAMEFTTAGDGPVVLSLPAWTPGAYEITYFARWAGNVAATGDGRPIHWEQADHDSWRLHTRGARNITLAYDYHADTLDNAMSWAREDFAFFNGTNVFPFPDEHPLDFAATVTIRTTPGWGVATGMRATGAPFTYQASSYHDLVDMPFFVGRFDYDSALVADRWTRLATYPPRALTGAQRARFWEQIQKMIPPQIAVFGEVPYESYTTLAVFDSAYGGASALEHQSSHLGIYSPFVVGTVVLPSITAHEIFHAWNVKRLRPAELWPYQYAEEQPTPLLWMSEGITDYYADISLVRGGVIDSTEFFDLTAGKIDEVADAPTVALEDASLATWVRPTDGTAYIYYPKGSLAGFMLDILIRDATDNRASLDDVMRALYRETYQQGRGFTTEQFWRAATTAAGGRSFADFHARYVDGREPFPWSQILPLAGMRLLTDTAREIRLGITTVPDPGGGVLVTSVDPEGTMGAAGVEPGDYLITIGDIPVDDEGFAERFRAAFEGQPGAPLPIVVRRDGQELVLTGRIQVETRLEPRLAPDPSAGEKAVRIRAGILRGETRRADDASMAVTPDT